MDPEIPRTIVSIESPSMLGTGVLVATHFGAPVFLVTAAHVVRPKGSRDTTVFNGIRFRFPEARGWSGVIVDSEIKDSGHWFFSEVYDLAGRYLPRRAMDRSTTQLDPHGSVYYPIDQFLSSVQLRVGAGVLVPGFPFRTGLTGFPILRRGTVATLDDSFVAKELEHPCRSCPLIESLIYPGNSGAPVIYTPLMPLPSDYSRVLNQPRLLGVVVESLFDKACKSALAPSQEPYPDPSPAPSPTPVAQDPCRVVVGLAVVVPADAISDLLNRDDVRAEGQRLESTDSTK